MCKNVWCVTPTLVTWLPLWQPLGHTNLMFYFTSLVGQFFAKADYKRKLMGMHGHKSRDLKRNIISGLEYCSCLSIGGVELGKLYTTLLLVIVVMSSNQAWLLMTVEVQICNYKIRACHWILRCINIPKNSTLGRNAGSYFFAKDNFGPWI